MNPSFLLWFAGHLLAELVRAKDPTRLKWYDSRQLLKMAEDIGNRLLPAFNTSSGIPYSRVGRTREVTFSRFSVLEG